MDTLFATPDSPFARLFTILFAKHGPAAAGTASDGLCEICRTTAVADGMDGHCEPCYWDHRAAP